MKATGEWQGRRSWTAARGPINRFLKFRGGHPGKVLGRWQYDERRKLCKRCLGSILRGSNRKYIDAGCRKKLGSLKTIPEDEDPLCGRAIEAGTVTGTQIFAKWVRPHRKGGN